jgi:hypothetical protein
VEKSFSEVVEHDFELNVYTNSSFCAQNIFFEASIDARKVNLKSSVE